MTDCPFDCCPSGEDCDTLMKEFKLDEAREKEIALHDAKWKAERGAIRDSMLSQIDEPMTLDEMSAFEKEWEDVNESDS